MIMSDELWDKISSLLNTYNEELVKQISNGETIADGGLIFNNPSLGLRLAITPLDNEAISFGIRLEQALQKRYDDMKKDLEE